MASEKPLCMSCSERPSVTSGPVKLCSVCKKLADGQERGIKFDKKSRCTSTP